MANLSKNSFDKCVCPTTPCSIFHPWNSRCIGGLSVFLWNVLIGSSKFFLPIYVVKLILNYKKINRKYLTDQMLAYLRTISYGVTFGALMLSSCCAIVKIHVNYFILMEAGSIGGLSLLLESTENKNLDKILFFNQVIEVIINILSSSKMIKRTRGSETLAFMFVVSALMYLFKIRVKRENVPLLWFYPEKSIYQTNKAMNGLSPEEGLNHKKSCIKHSLDGAYNYFLIGFLLEIIRKFLPQMFQYLRNPLRLIPLLINKDNVMMGAFLGGFVCIYRLICCYLKKKEQKELPSHSLIAAFIASGTYYLKPNIQIFIIALTSTLQLLWERFRTYFNLSTKIPYSQILFCISSGILIHYSIMRPEQCPNYVRNMVDIATNDMSKVLHTQFLASIRETEKYLASLNGHL